MKLPESCISRPENGDKVLAAAGNRDNRTYFTLGDGEEDHRDRKPLPQRTRRNTKEKPKDLTEKRTQRGPGIEQKTSICERRK
jgi:hypothetical protein